MDAFEELVAEILRADGYWVHQGFKVNLDVDDKRALGNPSMPRPEIDLVAYKAATSELLAIECKSYFDSGGVHARDLIDGGRNSHRYKMFVDASLRDVVLQRLGEQLATSGSIVSVAPRLGMVCGHITRHNAERLSPWLEAQGWFLHGPDWIIERLHQMSRRSYDNQLASVVAKLLLRVQDPPSASPAHI